MHKTTPTRSPAGSAHLRALLINTSLKRSASKSHTQLLLDGVVGIMEKSGVVVGHVYMLDHKGRRPCSPT